MFEIVLSSDANTFYQRADSVLVRKIDRCLETLERDPFRHNNIKRLTGDFAGWFRFRIDQWRVVYRVDREANTVFVGAIAHRKDVYE